VGPTSLAALFLDVGQGAPRDSLMKAFSRGTLVLSLMRGFGKHGHQQSANFTCG
jgi:hypothetical protein